MMTLAWMLLTYVGGVTERAAIEYVDQIEINHCGELTQVIFYNYSPSHARYRVVAWRNYKTLAQAPIKQRDGTYRATWHDGRKLRQVIAKSFIETWTDYDPEQVDGDHFNKDLRKELK